MNPAFAGRQAQRNWAQEEDAGIFNLTSFNAKGIIGVV
jgi:hypothetical protein